MGGSHGRGFYAEGRTRPIRQVTDRYPELAGDLTDCLSGDVNKDFSKLFAAVSEFVELPDALPYGTPAHAAAREILPA